MKALFLFLSINVSAQCANDLTAPSMMCRIYEFTGGQYIAATDLDTPFVTDNCDSNLVPVIYSFTPRYYAVGTYWMSWYVEDRSGNIGICNGYIIVRECINPVIIDSVRNGSYLTIWWNKVNTDFYGVHMLGKVYLTGDTFITVRWKGDIYVRSSCYKCCR